MIRIIDTMSIETGDLIAFPYAEHAEVGGWVEGHTDSGDFIVSTLAFGKITVSPADVTDVC